MAYEIKAIRLSEEGSGDAHPPQGKMVDTPREGIPRHKNQIAAAAGETAHEPIASTKWWVR